MIVTMVNATTGAVLAQQRVTRGTRLLDVRLALVRAMGGSSHTNEVHLIDDSGSVSNTAFSLPFAKAANGETFRVLMVDLSDEVYLRAPAAAPHKITVEMACALTGTALGQLKVTQDTRLLDVRPALVGAMGGGIRAHEVHVINGAGSVSKKAFSRPFAGAVSGETFWALMVELDDVVYLDLEDRRRGRSRGR
jgi:hypothetical protein